MEKQCTKCGQWKDETGFYKGGGYCKACKIAISRATYAPRKEATRAQRQQEYQDDLKRCRTCLEYQVTTEYSYHPTHWDRLSHQCKRCTSARISARYPEIRDRQLEGSRKWYQENRTRKLSKAAQWRKDNPDASHAIWHRYKARKQESGGTFTAEEWIILRDHYSPDGRCLCCGKKCPLAKDHVVPVAWKGPNTVANLQPLCQACNSAKGDYRDTDYRPDGGAFARGISNASCTSDPFDQPDTG